MHAQRVNYRALIWCHAHEQFPDVPSSDGHGWKIVDGSLDFEWNSDFNIPKELIGILCTGLSVDTGGGEEEDEDLATEADNMTGTV